MKKRIFFISCTALCLMLLARIFTVSGQKKIVTTYGTCSINEPVLLELLEDPTMLRLKSIHQYGLDYYTYKPENYNRYEHSIGVFHLARMFGADLKEQIASLLHDVSHTAFSHVADFLYRDADGKNSYQDDIHESFINKSSLRVVLEKHGFSVADILNKNEEFTILETDYPDLCADRLEYNLKGALLEGIISLYEVQNILHHLNFKDGKWCFDDIAHAWKFAEITIYLTLNKWAQPDLMMRNVFGSRMLRYAVDKGYITHAQIHNGIDDDIWDLLNRINDAIINREIMHLKNPSAFYRISNEHDYDIRLRPKTRVVDPWICDEHELKRLSERDSKFKDLMSSVKQKISTGYYIKLLD